MHFNPRYMLRVPFGCLKSLELLLCIIVLICIGVSNYPARGEGFVYFTAVGALVTVLIFSLVYVLGIYETISVIPWQFIEMVYSVVWGLCYFICVWVCMSVSIRHTYVTTNLHDAYGAATFFCIVAFIVFGANLFLLWRGFRAGDFHYSRRHATQTSATVVTTTTTTTAKY